MENRIEKLEVEVHELPDLPAESEESLAEKVERTGSRLWDLEVEVYKLLIAAKESEKSSIKKAKGSENLIDESEKVIAQRGK